MTEPLSDDRLAHPLQPEDERRRDAALSPEQREKRLHDIANLLADSAFEDLGSLYNSDARFLLMEVSRLRGELDTAREARERVDFGALRDELRDVLAGWYGNDYIDIFTAGDLADLAIPVVRSALAGDGEKP